MGLIYGISQKMDKAQQARKKQLSMIFIFRAYLTPYYGMKWNGALFTLKRGREDQYRRSRDCF